MTMATEQQKQAALAHIEARIRVAEGNGLYDTAQSWRDYHAAVALRPASSLVIARDFSTLDFTE
jgi:hypothetical protein